jgi:predicted DNA-binding transcriptional regulator AlpA
MPTHSAPPCPSPRFLRPQQVESLYGLSRKYLAHARARGDGPPYCKPSKKLVLYSVAELEAWLAQRRRVSTCDPGSED